MQNLMYLPRMKTSEQLALLSSYSSIDDQGIFRIIEQTNQGITYASFTSLTQSLPFTFSQWAGFLRISKRTLERIREEKKTIEAPGSEQIIRIVMLYHYGLSVFGDKVKFDQWLVTVSIPLGKQKPIDLFSNSYGVEAVRNELGRIEFGVLA